MGQIELFVLLLGVVAIVGFLFRKSRYPTSLFLVITGIMLSPFIDFPLISKHPNLVLNVFLPLLLYEITTISSWREYKKQIRPILLLSIGHVFFITIFVACLIHYFLPQTSWPLAFIIGAIVSPPDDVAIISIAEKVKMPSKIVTILEGEGIFNDATALILLRFSVVALISHQFILSNAAITFMLMVVGEIVYGVILGHVLGKLRTYLLDPFLHMVVSLITPFIAYLPAERLGGCGVISTITVGFIIGNYYSVKFTPEFRLLSNSVWPIISFVLQSFLFLLVGVNIDTIYAAISAVPIVDLIRFLLVVLFGVIIGRFMWVYPVTYLPNLIFRNTKKRKPKVPWQSAFLISWAGIRGAISLAAALSIPALPVYVDNVNARDFVTFLVFGIILFTLLIQGMSLPWLIKVLGVQKYKKHEMYIEKLEELFARRDLSQAAIQWLTEYLAKETNKELIAETKLQLKNYTSLHQHLLKKIRESSPYEEVDEENLYIEETSLLNKLIEVEKNLLIDLWEKEKISLAVRNKLMEQLDLRTKSILD
jgi:monovalent cation/hydrogen antiporter